MAGFSTRFFSTSNELKGFFVEQISEFQLYSFIEPFFPKFMSPVPPTMADTIFASDRRKLIHFCIGAPDLDRTYKFEEFVAEFDTRAALIVDGPYSESTRDLDTYSTMNDHEIWKKINRRLKKLAKAGVYSIEDPSRYIRDIRFTKGAKQLYDQGVRFRLTPNTLASLPDFE